MPKKLVGGVFLLCLTALTLTLSEDDETYTNITQPEILEQLTNLKNYISNPSMIKPVWVQLKNGDEIVVVQGELKVVDTGEFEICVKLNGYKLVISIEFTQVLNSDNEPLDDWYIDTNDAKYLFTTDAQNIGAITELPIFENIVDAQGHKRFIEGDIELRDDVTAFTKLYGKWSLSGTHLMFVLAIEGEENAEWTSNPLTKIIQIPKWIEDKIVTLYSVEVVQKTIDFRANDTTKQDVECYLEKYTEGVSIYLSGITLTKDRKARIQFDLIIDNAEPETQGE